MREHVKRANVIDQGQESAFCHGIRNP